ncbi:FAD binding domain-containing protein [Cladophialophora immunda]|nr:FAD binding domain-containing protein [Cladophialophora immunda]
MGSITLPISLQVIVVGGGISGLSAAIALRRAGHHVTVYEKYSADADAGAGIVVGANAVKVLRQWGLDLEGAGMLKYKAGYILEGKTLERLDFVYGEGSHVNDEKSNGEPSYMATRSDLRSMLRREVERDAPGQGTIEIRYAMEVLDYDPEVPAVRFADEGWKAADWVVACDGIKSKAARIVSGGENPPKATGMSAFRMLIPDEKLALVKEKFRQDHLIQEKFDKNNGTIWFVRGKDKQLVVWWTCRFGTIQAFDMLMPDNENYASSEDWTARCNKQVLLDEVGHWHPLFQEIFRAADEDPLLWKVCSRAPLDTLHKGKLSMLGDALHPMPPFRGQGGSQSIEDAGALEMIATYITDKADLPKRLEILDRVRVQERYIEVLNQCRKWFEGEDQSHLKSRAAFQQWLLSYDVREAAQRAVSTAT